MLQKVLITGVTGFTGSNLAKYLSNLGLEVYGLCLSQVQSGDEEYLNAVVETFYTDIRDKDSVGKVIQEIKPDFLFHLAGLVSSNDLDELLDINVLGTRNVLDATSPLNTRVLIPGSAAEYGLVPEDRLPVSEVTPLRPINSYGISKAAQTLLAYQYYLKNGCPVYISRTFNITGPGGSPNLVCSTIAKQIIDIKRGAVKPIIHIGNIDTKRDFLDVRDVVRAYWSIVREGRPGEIYNVCSGRAYSISEIIQILLKISRVECSIEQDHTRVRTIDIPIQVGDNKKIREETGWHLEIKLEDSMRDLLDYYRQET